jgi:hypothetical protein
MGRASRMYVEIPLSSPLNPGLVPWPQKEECKVSAF